MRAGDLIYRVTVRIRSSGSSGAYGVAGATYSDGATLWASVRTPAGRQELLAGQPRAAYTHSIEVRWPSAAVRATLVPTNMIRLEGRNLNIVWVGDPDGQKRRLRIGCDEVGPIVPATYPPAGA